MRINEILLRRPQPSLKLAIRSRNTIPNSKVVNSAGGFYSVVSLDDPRPEVTLPDKTLRKTNKFDSGIK